MEGKYNNLKSNVHNLKDAITHAVQIEIKITVGYLVKMWWLWIACMVIAL